MKTESSKATISDTTTELIRLRAKEQKKPTTPDRRLLINALEIAIVLSDGLD